MTTRRIMNRFCLMCSEVFRIYPSTIKTARFCSRRCLKKWYYKHGKKEHVICLQCGKNFDTYQASRFCSHGCSMRWSNLNGGTIGQYRREAREKQIRALENGAASKLFGSSNPSWKGKKALPHAGWLRKWRSKNNRGVAHGRVARALGRGILKKEVCQVCGESNAQAHHDDYSRPLEVRWLCAKHHSAFHRDKRLEAKALLELRRG